jgi:protein-L-isoaspartate O-methyltransferase
MSLSIDTSNAALASRYDEISYEAHPHAATHPDRLATVATFVGHIAPHVEQCSVLEVGCSDGSNLIPMAVSLPAARFVGCDLSPRALDEGRRTISALGLTNVTLVEGDWQPSHPRTALSTSSSRMACTRGCRRLCATRCLHSLPDAWRVTGSCT